MLKNKIVRCRIPQFNNSGQDIPARVEFKSLTNVIEKADDYNVVVETMAVDLKNSILNPNPRYGIMIFCDIKGAPGEPPIPAGLVFGPNYFYFNEEVKSVEQVLIWINDILHKKALPFNLGTVKIDDNNLFSLTISNQDWTDAYDSGYFQLYFNSNLASLLEGLCSPDNPIQGDNQLWYKMTDYQPGTITQPYPVLHRLCSIESLIFLTTLPVTRTNIFNPGNEFVHRSSVLATVEFNTVAYDLRSKVDFRYIPNTLRYTSMDKENPIDSFEVWVMIQYTDGSSKFHVLSPGERFNVNIAFYPITHNDLD